MKSKHDFMHVDGDHSLHGCLHDIESVSGSAATPGALILVDDYHFIGDVKNALRRHHSSLRISGLRRPKCGSH